MALAIDLYKRLIINVLCLFITEVLSAQEWKVMVGGTLIDGYGSTPIRNSVVMHGKRYK